jgi:hypothetical protein
VAPRAPFRFPIPISIPIPDGLGQCDRCALTFWGGKAMRLALGLGLILVAPGDRITDAITDCTWNTCIAAGVDWGVIGDATDDPRKDVDNTGNYGPENTFYPRPEDGTYAVMVEHWAAGMPDADGQVTINLLDRPPVVIPITDLAPHHVFTAATIEWPSKAVTVVGTDYDCTANWLSGCQDMIP